jgi:hypothetical protein
MELLKLFDTSMGKSGEQDKLKEANSVGERTLKALLGG